MECRAARSQTQVPKIDIKMCLASGGTVRDHRLHRRPSGDREDPHPPEGKSGPGTSRSDKAIPSLLCEIDGKNSLICVKNNGLALMENPGAMF